MIAKIAGQVRVLANGCLPPHSAVLIQRSEPSIFHNSLLGSLAAGAEHADDEASESLAMLLTPWRACCSPQEEKGDEISWEVVSV